MSADESFSITHREIRTVPSLLVGKSSVPGATYSLLTGSLSHILPAMSEGTIGCTESALRQLRGSVMPESASLLREGSVLVLCSEMDDVALVDCEYEDLTKYSMISPNGDKFASVRPKKMIENLCGYFNGGTARATVLPNGQKLILTSDGLTSVCFMLVRTIRECPSTLYLNDTVYRVVPRFYGVQTLEDLYMCGKAAALDSTELSNVVIVTDSLPYLSGAHGDIVYDFRAVSNDSGDPFNWVSSYYKLHNMFVRAPYVGYGRGIGMTRYVQGVHTLSIVGRRLSVVNFQANTYALLTNPQRLIKSIAACSSSFSRESDNDIFEITAMPSLLMFETSYTRLSIMAASPLNSEEMQEAWISLANATNTKIQINGSRCNEIQSITLESLIAK